MDNKKDNLIDKCKNRIKSLFSHKKSKYVIYTIIVIIILVLSITFSSFLKSSYADSGTAWSWDGYYTKDNSGAFYTDSRGYNEGYFYISLYKGASKTRFMSATFEITKKTAGTTNTNDLYSSMWNNVRDFHVDYYGTGTDGYKNWLAVGTGGTNDLPTRCKGLHEGAANDGACVYLAPYVKIRIPAGYYYGGQNTGYDTRYFSDKTTLFAMYCKDNPYIAGATDTWNFGKCSWKGDYKGTMIFADNPKAAEDSGYNSYVPTFTAHAEDRVVTGRLEVNLISARVMTRKVQVGTNTGKHIQSSESYNVNFLPNKTTIKFNANGGSGTMSNQIKYYDTAANINLNTFTKTGYTFSKWCTETNGGGTCFNNNQNLGADLWVTPNTAPVQNGELNLYAQWTANTTSITYNANGGSGAPSDQTKTYGSSLTLPTTKPTKQGYTFSKWCTGINGTGDCYNAGDTLGENIWPSTSSVTLYAIWENRSILVHYNSNTGSGSMSDQTLVVGVDSLTPNSFTKSGHYFNGWSTSSGGNVEYSDGALITISNAPSQNEVTLYAKWEEGDPGELLGTCRWTFNSTTGQLTIFPFGSSTCLLPDIDYDQDTPPWNSNNQNITSVYIRDGVQANNQLDYLFADLHNLVSADVSHLDISGASSLLGMFYDCYKIEHIDLGGWDFPSNGVMLEYLDNSGSLIGSFFKNAGRDTVNGAKITLNDSFNFNSVWDEGIGDYSDDSVSFPWGYYAVENQDGTLEDTVYEVGEYSMKSLLRQEHVVTFAPVVEIEFNKGSGSAISGSPNPMIIRYGEGNISTMGYSATKDGYVLSNWNTKSDGSGVSLNVNDNYSYKFVQEVGSLNYGKLQINKNGSPVGLIDVVIGEGSLYAQFSQTLTATFKYRTDDTDGSDRIETATATCNASGGSCTVEIPAVVRNSVGTYNLAYGGLASSLGTMNRTVAADATRATISSNQTFYVVYSTEILNHYYADNLGG